LLRGFWRRTGGDSPDIQQLRPALISSQVTGNARGDQGHNYICVKRSAQRKADVPQAEAIEARAHRLFSVDLDPDSMDEFLADSPGGKELPRRGSFAPGILAYAMKLRPGAERP